MERFPDKKNERYLSAEELSVLGSALTDAEASGQNPIAINAIRLLIFTGCRKSEVLKLRWDEVDFQQGYLNFPDSKTGQKRVPLGSSALEVLVSIKRIDGNPFVFPGEKDGSHFIGLPRIWRRIRSDAGLSDVRLHDLRHSFASVGVGAGIGLPVVGRLLGHRDSTTTARYAHVADDPAKEAAEKITRSLSLQLSKRSI